MKDVMIDLETFGNGKHAAICQIGGVYFDRLTGECYGELKINVDARTSVASGADMDADTIYWWLSQSKEAISSVTKEPIETISYAMNELNTFLAGADNIWSHATFDFVIVTETLKRLGIKPLFSYRAARDIRTLMELSGVKTKDFALSREGTHHDALDDAKFQVKYCVAAMRELII